MYRGYFQAVFHRGLQAFQTDFSVPQSPSGNWSGFQPGACAPFHGQCPPLLSFFQGIRRCLPDNFPSFIFQSFCYTYGSQTLPFLRFFFSAGVPPLFVLRRCHLDGMNTPPVPVTSTRLSQQNHDFVHGTVALETSFSRDVTWLWSNAASSLDQLKLRVNPTSLNDRPFL